MNDSLHALALIAVIAAVTAIIRFLPFWVFSKNSSTPQAVVFLGKFLPCAIMVMLVVYCLKGVSFLSAPYGIPEAIAVAVVVGLYIWKRSTLLSILTGTLCYMALVQFVFL